MLATQTYNLISKAFAHSTHLKILPFIWNPKTYKLSCLTFKSQKTAFILYHLVSYYLCLYTAYIWSGYFYYRDYLKENQIHKVLQLVFALGYSLVSTFVLNTMFNREKMASFINSYFQYLKILDGK